MTATSRFRNLGSLAPGMSNRRQDHELSATVSTDDGPRRGTFARSGVNVDITRDGTYRRRAGYAKVLDGDDCHSLWSSGQGEVYFVDYDTLYALGGTPSSPVKTAVFAGLVPGRRVSYAKTPYGLFYSDGVSLRVLREGDDRQAGVPLMDAYPLVVATTGGALEEGLYQLCFVFEDDRGEHSPATPAEQVEVAEGGVITIAALPAAWPANVVALHVFMTSRNGEIPLKAATLLNPQTMLNIPTFGVAGMRCMTHRKDRMPAGGILRFSNGRLLSAAGSVLHYSDAFFPTLYDASKNYIHFAAPISVVEPCGNGVYVVADKTYWLGGDIANAELQPVLNATGVPGTSGADPDATSCWWMSSMGQVVAAPGGRVETPQHKEMAFAPALAGATVHRDRDGMRQLITSLFGPGQNVAAASSYMDAEIARKESLS